MAPQQIIWSLFHTLIPVYSWHAVSAVSQHIFCALFQIFGVTNPWQEVSAPEQQTFLAIVITSSAACLLYFVPYIVSCTGLAGSISGGATNALIVIPLLFPIQSWHYWLASAQHTFWILSHSLSPTQDRHGSSVGKQHAFCWIFQFTTSNTAYTIWIITITTYFLLLIPFVPKQPEQAIWVSAQQIFCIAFHF